MGLLPACVYTEKRNIMMQPCVRRDDGLCDATPRDMKRATTAQAGAKREPEHETIAHTYTQSLK